MGVEGLLLLIPALVSLIYHEKSVISFLIVAAILLAIYMVFGRKLPASKQIYGKEGFVIVGLAWILWSAFGALPFVISGSIPHYIDALFETISGFTTTGSTILVDIEALQWDFLLAKLYTWIGGDGSTCICYDDHIIWMMRMQCRSCVRKYRDRRQISLYQRQDIRHGFCMECTLY